MNAAARSINQSNFFHGQLADMRMTKPLFFQGTLLVSVLVSALAVVYTTNVHRMTLSQLEMSQHKAHRLQLKLGQLLLEQASLATPSRVERLATDKLNMVLPSDKQTRVLRVR